MSSCCEVPEQDPVLTCPVSHTRGKRIKLQAVKALLSEYALRRLNALEHRFCPDSDCDVVYFDRHGNHYTKADLRVPVWQKEPFGDRTVCYCFGENEADIRREIEQFSRSEAVARVRQHIDAGRCACEIRNPRGICCLGDLAAAVKRVADALKMEAADVHMST